MEWWERKCGGKMCDCDCRAKKNLQCTTGKPEKMSCGPCLPVFATNVLPMDGIHCCNDLSDVRLQFWKSLSYALCMTGSLMMNNRFVPLLWFPFLAGAFVSMRTSNRKRAKSRARAMEMETHLKVFTHILDMRQRLITRKKTSIYFSHSVTVIAHQLCVREWVSECVHVLCAHVHVHALNLFIRLSLLLSL